MIPEAVHIEERRILRAGRPGGLNLSDVPAVFLEACNMRNPTDAALLTSPTHQEAIAQAIAAALIA